MAKSFFLLCWICCYFYAYFAVLLWAVWAFYLRALFRIASYGKQVMELLGTVWTKSTHFSFSLQGPGFWVMGWNLSSDHAFCLITTLSFV